MRKSHYYKVLTSRNPHYIVNRGLWFKNSKFIKYSQKKSGLSFLLTKRQTRSDSITLDPLPEPLNGVDAQLDNSFEDTEGDDNIAVSLMDIDDVSDSE